MDEQTTEIIEEHPEAARRRKQRIVRHQAEQFAALAQMPVYAELTRLLEQQVEKLEAELLADVRSRQPVDQRKVDRSNGFIDGLRYIDQVTRAAARKLEQFDSQETAVSEPDEDRGLW